MHLTLFVYLTRNFLSSIFIVIAGISSVFLISNSIDLLKKTAKTSTNNTTVFEILVVVLAKVPYLLQESLPYIVFIATILTLHGLSKKNEYVILKASGLSFWSFISPFIITGLVIGILFITILNPLSSYLVNYYDRMHAQIVGGVDVSFTFRDGKVWLVDQDKNKDHYTFINAEALDFKNMDVIGASFIKVDKNFKFLKRIDAHKARLVQDNWLISSGSIYTAGDYAKKITDYSLPTNINKEDIENNFFDPEQISIWEMAYVMKQLNSTGYSTIRHNLYLHKLLNKPFLICVLILIASSFSLKAGRQAKAYYLITKGILLALVTFFIGELSTLIASNNHIQPIFAMIMANLTLLSIAVAALYQSEEI